MQDNVVYTEDNSCSIHSKKPHTFADIHVGSYRSSSIGNFKVKSCNRHLQSISFWGLISRNEIGHTDTEMYNNLVTSTTWFWGYEFTIIALDRELVIIAKTFVGFMTSI